MDLSAIIVNRNTRDLLCQCLDSLTQKVGGIKMEVLVVDNGSTDGSVAVVRQKFPGVRLIENPVNMGFARANNQAISVSSGEYLLLLNPDTQVKDEAIPKMLSFLNAHPEAGLAGAQLLNVDGSKQNSIANFPSLATELINKSLLRRLFPKKFPGKETDYPSPVEVDSVIGACMLVRREAMEQVGLLDEEYFLFLEETDWCYRMKKAGWKVYHIPQAKVIHFQGKSAEQDKKRAKVEYDRSRYHFFMKNRGTFQWVILLIGVVVKLLIEFTYWTVICSLTFFTQKKWKKKLTVVAHLLEWHLKGCPEGMGLKPVK
jgi:hypothetical protein